MKLNFVYPNKEFGLLLCNWPSYSYNGHNKPKFYDRKPNKIQNLKETTTKTNIKTCVN